MKNLTQSDIIRLRVSPETLETALTLARKFVKIGNPTFHGSPLRNELISILAEFATSQYLTGSIESALKQRETGIDGDLVSGSDLDGYDIDVKCIGGKNWHSAEIYVKPRVVSEERTYVLAMVDVPLHATEEELEAITRVSLIGWCHGSQLWEGMENFHHGWKYRAARALAPIGELKDGLHQEVA